MTDAIDGAAMIRRWLLASAEAKRRTAADCAEAVARAADLVAACYRRGGTLLLCGNGGSAGDSQHIAAEFVGRAQPGRDRRALPAIALTTDTSALTAIANDYGYDEVFSRQVLALGRPGDVLVGISTSGNSANVVRAVAAAREVGIGTVGLLGAGGGRIAPLVDVAIVVPDDFTPRIQECHIAIGQALCELVELTLFPELRTE
jgi:D-sedoheptulose 7-phosphate isomerase